MGIKACKEELILILLRAGSELEGMRSLHPLSLTHLREAPAPLVKRVSSKTKFILGRQLSY
jgi:hypothetical protein